MIGNILTPTHLLLVLGVALLVLGPKRLPEVGRGLGSAIRDFRDSLSAPDIAEERPAIQSADQSDRAPGAPSSDPSIVSRPEDTNAR